MTITVRGLAALKVGKWLSEPGNKNEGALRAKASLHGPRFYYRYRDSSGSYDDFPIGSFDVHGKRGMTLIQAREHVAKLRARYLAGDRDLRAVLEAEERERQRIASEHEEAAVIERLTKRATLGALLEGYVLQLKRDGKPSAASVEGTLQRHVAKAWPVLWETPATQVTTDDLLAVLGRLTDVSKLREAGKLRAYLSAAYASAIRARQDARGLAALRELKITTNPARDLVAVDGGSQARERALSEAELRAYWKRISSLPEADGALLRFHLLTGGQRTEQLGRLTADDFDSDSQTIRLRDGKGRRKLPRIHDVPLVPAAADAMRAMRAEGRELGPYLVTITHGQSGAAYTAFQHRLRAVVEAMKSAGELEKGAFTIGDLRRTVETRLAAAGLNSDILAQLQSHGLGGVQSRHYNKHDYLAEKREALETLYRLITSEGATVTRIRARA